MALPRASPGCPNIASPEPQPPGADRRRRPVYNEQGGAALVDPAAARPPDDQLPFAWRIVIADNASTDETPRIAAALAADLPGVEVLALPQKGAAARCAPPGGQRRRRPRATWTSTCRPISGAAAARRPAALRPQRRGDRQPPGRRRARRARAQARAHLAQLQPPAAPVARRALLRRPVRLQGRARRRRPPAAARRSSTTAGSSTPSCSSSPSARACASTRCPSTGSTTPTRAWTSCAPRSTTCAASALLAGARLIRARSGCSTIAYALLYLAAARPARRRRANALALALTAVANTHANRRYKPSGIRGRDGLLRQHAMGAFVYVLTLGLTAGRWCSTRGPGDPSRAVELAVLIAASVCACHPPRRAAHLGLRPPRPPDAANPMPGPAP